MAVRHAMRPNNSVCLVSRGEACAVLTLARWIESNIGAAGVQTKKVMTRWQDDKTASWKHGQVAEVRRQNKLVFGEMHCAWMKVAQNRAG